MKLNRIKPFLWILATMAVLVEGWRIKEAPSQQMPPTVVPVASAQQ